MSPEKGGALDHVELAATKTTSVTTRRTANPGELLRAARELRGLSAQQMGDELHLDLKVIEALESNDFESLGPPVYVKGYLRKYAGVLGLAPDEVIEEYHALSGVPVVPPVLPTATAMAPGASRRSQSRVSLVKPAGGGRSRKVLWIIAGLVLAAGLAWVAKWLLERFGFGGLGG